MSDRIVYDSFPPFCRLHMEGFEFPFNYIEIWEGGQAIDEFSFNGIIRAEIVYEDNKRIARISMPDLALVFIAHIAPYLKLQNDFDDLITGDHRLQYIRVPAKTNTTCVGLTMMQMLIGSTIPEKNFQTNEPYCCNVFLKNRCVAKVSFSLCNPERLIEFTYQI